MQGDKQKAEEIDGVLPADRKRRELVAKLAKLAVAAPLATLVLDVSSTRVLAS